MFGFYKGLGVKDLNIQAATSPLDPLLRIFSITPPLVLAFFFLGFFLILFKKTKGNFKEEYLLLFWFLVPVLRVSFPGAETMGTVRNYLEFLPGFAAIAGLGFFYLIKSLSETKKTLCLFAYGVILIGTIISIHPNENIYFNFLPHTYSWQNSYDNVYRQGVNWLNANAPKGARLAYLDGTMLSISPLWLRPDITFGTFFSGFEQNGEYIISLVYPIPPEVFGYKYLENFLNPLYVIKINNQDILKIWQNDKTRLKQGYASDKVVDNLKIEKKLIENRQIWEIKFDKNQKITRLMLNLPEADCDSNGIFSLINSGKETFFVPQFKTDKTKMEVDFPGEEADSLRFWNVEGTSCLYNAELVSLSSLQN